MRKIFYVGDHGASGFGTVAKGLLSYLHSTGEYEILQLGINYMDTAEAGVPWRVVPAGFWYPEGNNTFNSMDPYGYIKAQTFVQQFDPDIVFINNDFTVVDKYFKDQNGRPTPLAKHRSRKVLYAPLDSWPFPPSFAKSAKLFDQVIAYSAWQYDLMRVDPAFSDVPILYHGVDLDTFYPMNKATAKQELKAIFRKYAKDKKAEIPNFDEKFMVFFVGTNQWRKNLPCLFRAFVEFNRVVPEAFLLPLTSMMPMTPSHGGWQLFNLRDLIGLKNSVILQHANVFTPAEINVMYNAADVLAYPTRGEGFGLPSLEAMATKTPVIATRFGPQYELHTDGRGYFIDVLDFEPGANIGSTYFANPSHISLTEQLLNVYNNPDPAKETAETAYEWVLDHSWDAKGKQLAEILDKCLSVSKHQLRSKSTRKHQQKT